MVTDTLLKKDIFKMSELEELKKTLKRLERKKKKTPGDGWFKILLRKKIHELENK